MSNKVVNINDKRKISNIRRHKMCKPKVSSDYKFTIEWWDEAGEIAVQRCIAFDSDSMYQELTEDGHEVAGQIMLYVLMNSIESSEKFRKKFKSSILSRLNDLDLDQ